MLIDRNKLRIYWCRCLSATVLTWHSASLLAAKEAPAPLPAFSVPRGIYTNDFALELKAEKAVVRFSLDGSEPSPASPVYTKPLQVTNCLLVRARAWYSDGRLSPTVSQSYVLLDNDLRPFSSNLPLVVVQRP